MRSEAAKPPNTSTDHADAPRTLFLGEWGVS